MTLLLWEEGQSYEDSAGIGSVATLVLTTWFQMFVFLPSFLSHSCSLPLSLVLSPFFNTLFPSLLLSLPLYSSLSFSVALVVLELPQ